MAKNNTLSEEERQFYKELGSRLKKAREEKGFGVVEAAEGVGISHSQLSNIEAGRRNCNLYDFVRLKSLYGQSYYDFLP